MLIQYFSEYIDTAHVTQSGESEAFENVALRMRWLRKLGSLNNLARKRSVKKTDELALVSQNTEKSTKHPTVFCIEYYRLNKYFSDMYHHWKQHVVVCEKGRRDNIRIIMIYGPSTIAIYLHMGDIRCSPNAIDRQTVGDIVNDVRRKIGPELPFALLCYVATGLWNWIAKP